MSDPPAAPTGAIAPKSAKLRFRLGPGGKVMPSRATMFGTMRPPPIPHKPLIKHIATRLLANPPHKAQRTHQTPPAVSMFLWPYTAPKRPPIRTKAPWVRGYDATTQVDWIRVAPNASPIASPELIPAPKGIICTSCVKVMKIMKRVCRSSLGGASLLGGAIAVVMSAFDVVVGTSLGCRGYGGLSPPWPLAKDSDSILKPRISAVERLYGGVDKKGALWRRPFSLLGPRGQANCPRHP
jgi:hypothetical protein